MSEQGIDRTSHPRPETQQDPIPTYRAYTIGPTGHIIASALLANCTDDLAWERVSTRNRSLAGSLFIAPNTFQVLKSRFEPLEDDEERIEIAPFDTR